MGAQIQNEAADALSKDNNPRLWHNIQGDKALIELTPDHLRLPTTANGPKRARLTPAKIRPKYTTGERHDGDQTHVKRLMKADFAMPSQASEKNLNTALEGALAACKKAAKKKVQVSGRNHFVAVWQGLGFKDLAPPLDIMQRRVRKLMAADIAPNLHAPKWHA